MPAAQVNANAWLEFIAPITPSTGFLNIPSDLVLRVYADGTPTNGAGFLVENIEIFPTAEPYNTSLVRALVRRGSRKLRRRERLHERFRR